MQDQPRRSHLLFTAAVPEQGSARINAKAERKAPGTRQLASNMGAVLKRHVVADVVIGMLLEYMSFKRYSTYVNHPQSRQSCLAD